MPAPPPRIVRAGNAGIIPQTLPLAVKFSEFLHPLFPLLKAPIHRLCSLLLGVFVFGKVIFYLHYTYSVKKKQLFSEKYLTEIIFGKENTPVLTRLKLIEILHRAIISGTSIQRGGVENGEDEI